MKVKEVDNTNDPVYRRAVNDTRHQIMKDLEDVIAIQCSNGNWNYDPYMQGLANGLLMAEALIKNEEPVFLNAPKKWLKDYPTFWTKVRWFFKKPSPVAEAHVTNEKNNI